jgi:hypothetical protein
MQPEELCEVIRHLCVVRHWYGPDMHWPSPAVEDDPRRFGFAFPPVTTAHMRKAEELLGFPLPANLRALYHQLANGGFGPHYGLLRLIGDASEFDRTVVELYQECSERCTFFDLEGLVQPGKTSLFADTVWPRHMLRICEEGCGNYICIHPPTEHIFRIGIWDAHEYDLTYVADSLDAWLQAWAESLMSPQGE